MDNLRLILILIGIVLLGGIYLWGVTAAKRDARREKKSKPGKALDNELELLERVQDSRAATNAESLKEFTDYDIDAGIDEEPEEKPEKPRAPVAEAETVSEQRVSVPEEIEEDEDTDTDTGRLRAVFAEDVREREPEAEKIDLVASLSEIQATLAPDPTVEADQLDLLREEEKAQPADAPSWRDRLKSRIEPRKEETPEAMVLAVTVMAKEGERFNGGELHNWLQALKLSHGDMGIFHYRPPGKAMRAPPTFSVSSVTKPGSFDPDTMAETTVPGVALFLQLPGPDDPTAAFEEMLRTARKLAEGLGGMVCDDGRNTLTGQAINHMRERIAEFSRKQRLRF